MLDLSHVISSAGLFPDTAKLRVIADWPIFETVGKMQFFLELIDWYCDYISDATKLIALLYNLIAARKTEYLIKLTATIVEYLK